MRPWIKRSLAGAASLAALAAVTVVAAAAMGDRKLARRIDVAVAPVADAAGPGAIARGDYLFRSRGCGDCHGADGAGRVVVDDGHGMLVRAPNLTPGGVTTAYAPVDWVRTIRHGVKPDGRPLMIMPSEEYNRLTDADVGALIAFVRQLPPAQGEPATIRLPLPVRVLYAVGVVRDAAEKIDHGLPPAQPVAEGVTSATARMSRTPASAAIGPT